MPESKASVFSQFNTSPNVSLQLMQLRPITNTVNLVDVSTEKVEDGLKMSIRSRVKVV